jgi:23S rRNA (cytidine1920-2'-O)/16S rRNA (cytidine1409-2'-O)-methyltransferase
VRRGLAASRERAQADIVAGRVRVGGAVAEKPARLVAAGEPLDVVGPPPRFVSRGGDKLDAALEKFGVAVAGRTALDAGASTGGFTDCLLQRGAATIVAVDVGNGQLDARLRADARVMVRERTNVRHVALGEPVDIVVADLAFVSLRTVAGTLMGLVAPGGDVVVLVKPQFEAGRPEVSKGKGVIRDPVVWRLAVEGVKDAFEAAGAAMMGLMVSPLRGAEGNVEFLAHFRPAAGAPKDPAPDIAAVVAEAAAR